jgi:hypothetical protein
MEVVCYSETLVHIWTTLRSSPLDGNNNPNYCCELLLRCGSNRATANTPDYLLDRFCAAVMHVGEKCIINVKTDRFCGIVIRVRFPALPDFLGSSGSGTGLTQPREYK